MLAADPFGSNPLQPLDVSRDGSVTPLDALQVINAIVQGNTDPAESIGTFVDVDSNGQATPLDALLVINSLVQGQPILAATLPSDSAPSGREDLEFDLVTNDFSLDLTVSVGALSDSPVLIRIGDQQPDFTEITDQFIDGTASLSTDTIETIFGGPLPDGSHDVVVQLGESGSRIEFTITVDRAAPQPQPIVGDIVRVATDFIDVDFGEPIETTSIDPGAFALTQAGLGSIDIQSTQEIGDGLRLSFPETLADAEFELSFAGTVTDLAGNTSTASVGSFTVADPTGVLSISPANGETRVNVTRETIVQFDEPVDPTTVTADTFQVIAAGQPISGTIRVNRTGTTATFFYDDPLPASTAVSVVLDGQAIVGVDGLPS